MSIRVNVDPTNPGQFFACCGLLELADRLWPGAEGAFSLSGTEFFVTCKKHPDASGDTLLRSIAACRISSTMSEEQTARLKKLKNMKKTLRTAAIVAEMETLDALWERERISLGEPFNLWLDWWFDERAGGNRFKTWAGKQFIIDLVRAIQVPLRNGSWLSLPSTRWLTEPTSDGSLPLYFDSDIRAQSASIDVGFSLDSLEMRGRTKPLLEFAAFAGLQRFRACEHKRTKSFAYATWTDPCSPLVASIACCGALSQGQPRTFEFRLLYRTQYLKSFLPATPKGT